MLRFRRVVFFVLTLIVVGAVINPFGIVGRRIMALDYLAAAAGVDVSSVPADLVVPEMEEAKPAAGKRVRQTLPGYQHTDVYHSLYLPKQWQPEKSGVATSKLPVIVEFAGNGPYKNEFGDVSTGKVEHSKLGFGISAGEGFIWICMPLLNAAGTKNVTRWWGDAPEYNPQPTVEYCQKTVRWVCEHYGGDLDRVLLTGFSRGAIACNYIGLHDEKIASLWRAMVVYSHYDGVVKWGYPFSDRTSAVKRLQRLGDCPQFICHENKSARQTGLEQTRTFLNESGIDGDFTFHLTGFRNHNDTWVLRPSEARKAMRAWLIQHFE
ncbi:MAG: hypothetical protein HOB29_13840 [Planctomycetaceae bacterium]|nr:hypothetical protein [Planctomycetaceae bacterium]